MPACNATFKFGLKFVNWGTRPFYSPFEPYPEIENFSLAEWWLKTKVSSHPVDYANFTAPVLCDAQRSPLYFGGATFAPTVAYPYAYQFDAKRLADYLQATAVGRGVEHIVGDIVATPLKHNGEIAAVRLATGERLAADPLCRLLRIPRVAHQRRSRRAVHLVLVILAMRSGGGGSDPREPG